MLLPHANSAQFYDTVYSEMNAYTAQTVAAIQRCVQPPASIIDFGAGTGRITLPLAHMNYRLTAVEQSREMCAVLQQQLKKHTINLPIQNCSIEHYEGERCAMALALFTVFSYSLTEALLRAQLQTICTHIVSGGYFFFDLPHLSLFESQERTMRGIRKHIRIEESAEANIFNYSEHCVSTRKKEAFAYHEEFQLRYWTPEFFAQILTEYGMKFIQTLPEFTDMEADYCLWQKQ
ncbi:MAG: class I SAM-dependent methyltransferase [Bacteroidales bacterium]|jgi:SAM-dependent methyltransferase|nr:class I SAM-dependent methyltransferase [Bacteroidales bacterium]